ncbi:hypothetical protein BDV59DRAFT_168090 [Aspergillus ambiguus]|uniref:uncharacterized protein n=1 Tax=Aspergillus ambiguus TaxID=176160 RepID=UPI003CCCC4AC
MVEKPDPSSWKLISTTMFNGQREDHFSKTSLHLWFTGCCMPLVEPFEHRKNPVLWFRESVVSVHDSGNRVGDIDILKAIDDDRITYFPHVPCVGDHDEKEQINFLISAERWADVLEPPEVPLIFRANGNWIARLSAVAIAAQIFPTDRIVVCRNDTCWHCARDDQELSFDLAKLYIY